MHQLLDGISVHEAGSSPAVRYAGRLFALAGAAVHRAASEPDHLDDYLDVGKHVGDRHLPGRPDVVLADPDLDWDRLPGDVLSGTVDPFGPSGARAHWKGPEIILASVGGATDYTRTPDGTPVYGFGRRFQYLSGEYLYIALAGLLGRPAAGGIHPRVRVAADEVVAALLPYGPTQYAYNGATSTVEQSGPRFLVECTDGHLCVYAGGAWAGLSALLDGLVEPDDDRFVRFARRFECVDELDALVQRWASSRTVAGAIADADRCSVAVAPCHDLDDVLSGSSLAGAALLPPDPATGRGPGVPGLSYRIRNAS